MISHDLAVVCQLTDETVVLHHSRGTSRARPYLRRETRRAVRRPVRRATLRDPNMSYLLVVAVMASHHDFAAAAVSMSCSALASSADISPISMRSSGLINPSPRRKPPARAIASRSGTAQ